MRILLDTHPLLWFAVNDPKLSAAALNLILDPGNLKLVSPASYWEVAIKISTGKYILRQPYEDFMKAAIDFKWFSVPSYRTPAYGSIDKLALPSPRSV